MRRRLTWPTPDDDEVDAWPPKLECQWVGLSPDGETICHNEPDAGRYCTRHAAVARSYDFEQAIANYRRHR